MQKGGDALKSTHRKCWNIVTMLASVSFSCLTSAIKADYDACRLGIKVANDERIYPRMVPSRLENCHDGLSFVGP